LTAITESKIKYSLPLLTIKSIYTTAFSRWFKGYFYTYSKFHSRDYSPYIYVDFNRTHTLLSARVLNAAIREPH